MSLIIVWQQLRLHCRFCIAVSVVWSDNSCSDNMLVICRLKIDISSNPVHHEQFIGDVHNEFDSRVTTVALAILHCCASAPLQWCGLITVAAISVLVMFNMNLTSICINFSLTILSETSVILRDKSCICIYGVLMICRFCSVLMICKMNSVTPFQLSPLHSSSHCAVCKF